MFHADISKKVRRAFSLIELMVVIIGILSAIGTSIYTTYKGRATVVVIFNLVQAFQEQLTLYYQRTDTVPLSANSFYFQGAGLTAGANVPINANNISTMNYMSGNLSGGNVSGYRNLCQPDALVLICNTFGVTQR
jgi:type II secretory pathway pseudopilin PulG